MGVQKRQMMKRVIAILVVCSICGILSQDEFVAAEFKFDGVHDFGCQYVAKEFGVCANQKYAANQGTCEKHAQQLWEQFQCAKKYTTQVKDVTDVPPSTLIDETAYESADEFVETVTSEVEDTNVDEVLLGVQSQVVYFF